MPQQLTSKWKHLYDKALWRRRAKAQIQNHPLCAMCMARNIVTPATIADHIEPHGGDHERFYWGPLQSLCPPCHSSRKKQLELHGYARDIGADGWPIDPAHPANRSSSSS